MTDYKKPIPEPDIISTPYWTAARRHEFFLQKCTDCPEYVFPPREICPYCLSGRLEWVESSGIGIVYSFTVIRRAAHPAFSGDVPYILAIIELKEGPRLISNVIECNIEKIQIGMPVKVAFDDVTEDCTLVKFKPD